MEFSPRPIGGLVPDLVELAYGVSLDRLAIQLFLGETPAVDPAPWSDRFVGRRATGRSTPPPAADAELVRVDERDSAGTTLRDEIWRVGAGR